MTNPRIGQPVQCWYGKAYCHNMPLHGRVGVVVLRGRGKPRNHGVLIDGVTYCVPCGNLRKVEEPA